MNEREFTRMPYIYGGYSDSVTGCILASMGAINEPKLGIALLFEKMLLVQSKGLVPHFGGNWTAYAASGANLAEVIANLSQVVRVSLREKDLDLAKAKIKEDFLEIIAQPVRHMKFLYEQMAFYKDGGCTLLAKLNAIESYGVAEVREFAEKYYSAENLAFVYAGPQYSEKELSLKTKEYFGAEVFEVPEPPKTSHNFYFGGFYQLKNDEGDNTRRLMLGFKATDLSKEEIAAAQILVAYVRNQLKYEFEKQNLQIHVDFRGASFYGELTLRMLMTSETESAQSLVDKLLSVLTLALDRLCPDFLLDRAKRDATPLVRYEGFDNLALKKVLEFHLQDVNKVDDTQALYEVSAVQMQEVAQKIFSHSRLTYIVMAPEGERVYSYRAIMSVFPLSELTEEEKKQTLFL